MARRTREEALKTRQNILRAALDIFSENSYAEVSMSDIAAAVHMTKGAVYWHFRNKSDLLLKLLEYVDKQAETGFTDVCGKPQDVSSLRHYYIAALAHRKEFENYNKLHRLMVRHHEWPKEVQETVKEMKYCQFRSEVKMVGELLKKDQDNGSLRPDVKIMDIAELITAMFYGFGVLQFIDGILPDNFIDRLPFLFDMLEQQLGTKPEQAQITKVTQSTNIKKEKKAEERQGVLA